MSRLDGIIRLRKWELDEQRRQLAEIQAECDAIVTVIDAIEDERAQQAREYSGSEVSALTYGAYLEGTRMKQEMFTKLLREKEVALDEHRDKVAESFRELKTFEIAREREYQRIAQAEAKEEQDAFDELGIQNHAREEAMVDAKYLKMRR